MTKKIISPLVALAAVLGVASLSACNTMEGVGRDVQQAGQALEQSAEEANDDDPKTP